MLKRLDFLGLYVIPMLAMMFVILYWTIGMMKYNSPDWSDYVFLLPEYQVMKNLISNMSAENTIESCCKSVVKLQSKVQTSVWKLPLFYPCYNKKNKNPVLEV